MKSRTRISYPLLSTSTTKKIITPILALLRNMRGEEMRVERRRAPAVIRQVRGGARGRLRRGSSGRGIPTTAVGCRGSSGRGIPTTAVGYPLQRASVVVHRRGVLGSKRGRDVQMCRGDRAFCDIVTRPVTPVAKPPWSPRLTTRWGTPARRGSHWRWGHRRHSPRRGAGRYPTHPRDLSPPSKRIWAGVIPTVLAGCGVPAPLGARHALRRSPPLTATVSVREALLMLLLLLLGLLT